LKRSSKLGETAEMATDVRRRTNYIAGNTARQLHALPDEYIRPVRKVNHAPRKNRDKALHMNIGYVLFLGAALIAVGLVLTSYLTIKSEITSSIKHISQLESQLNSMKLDNDERLSRISSSTNLEEVRQTAIQELGMQYAGEGQIISFNSEDNDYVIQKGEIPD
jgi:type VI protein secretion system component VasK